MYAKGANILHTLRQMIDDDQKWRQILRGLNEEFYHQTVKTEQIENYIAKQTGLDLKPFFDQYLRDTRIPTFEYALLNGKLQYRWANCIKGFNMKLKVKINGKVQWLEPTQKWQNLSHEEFIKSVEVDRDFYVASFLVSEVEAEGQSFEEKK